MAGNDPTRPFSSRKTDVKSTVVARIGCTPYTAPAYGQTCVRTLHYAYAVVNSTTHNWAHLTSKHPQSPQKMGEGDYGRTPKGFCPLFDFGEAGRPSHNFSYFFHIFFTIGFGQQLFKVLRKTDGIHRTCTVANPENTRTYLLTGFYGKFRARLNFRRRPFLCTTLYRNPKQASNFDGAFDQLFLWIFYEVFTEDISLFFLYHGAKKSKMTKTPNKGSCLKRT